MKRLGLWLLAAFVFWTAVFSIGLCAGDGGLTLYFEVPPEAEGMEMSFIPEGVVRMRESRVSEDGEEMAVRLEALGRGRAEARLTWEGVQEDGIYADELTMTVYSLPFGILFDSITWNFTGWGYLAGCMSLFLMSAAVILFLTSQRERKRSFFSYRSTAELGVAVFLLVTSFFRIDVVFPFLRGENAGTVWSLLVGVIVSAQTFMRWTAVVLAVFSVLTALSNLVLIRHEGFRPSNMLGIAVAALTVGGAFFGIWLSYSQLIFPLRNQLLNVYASLFVYFECLLTATVIRAAEAGRHEPAYDKDYVLILGCRIRPDGSLYPLIRGRVDRAIAFARAQEAAGGKQPVLIPSGGQGPDEPMAEAEAMARYILEQGIDGDHVLIENRSRTTVENLNYSHELIAEDGRGDKVAFSTSSYHVYRGGILASEAGWNIDGMGSRTRWYFWPNAFLREFIGLLAARRIQQAVAALVIAGLSVGLTLLVM